MAFRQTAMKSLESRVEGLVQKGRESQRHLAALISSYSLKAADVRLRWLVRNTLDLHARWRSARRALGGVHGTSHSPSL